MHPFASDLQSPDARRRRRAVQSLCGRGAAVPPSALGYLVPLLEDEDDAVCEGAVEALGNVGRAGGPAVHSILVGLYRLLVSPEPTARMRAAQTLGCIGPNARLLIPALTAALRDRDLVVARLASEALVKIGPEAAAALERLLDDPDARVRREARWGFNKLNGKTVNESTSDTALRPLNGTAIVPQKRSTRTKGPRAERRRDPRHPCRREAFYRFLGDLGHELWWKAEIRDISATGLGLILSRPAATGARLTLDLREVGLGRWVVARVARCCPIAGGWFAGCSVTRAFTPDEVRRLHDA